MCSNTWAHGGTFLIQAKAAPMCQVSTGLDDQSSEKLILKAELELGEMTWFVPPPILFQLILEGVSL